jgi:alanyl-tRNA synthetase/REP element-mobilizing transposase RayT
MRASPPWPGVPERLARSPVGMTSREIRQSFLDFFREKGHTIVPSSSLLPDAPNLLFTNAGMNQFVPIFLGQQKPPWDPPRVADTQKCIRAGGKHNDLEDVGLDTYHHTFFEMLGNWSFGDYFKREATEWAWELVVERWKFPPERLYATVYCPGPDEPATFDQEAYDHWARLFREADLDPAIHVVSGDKKDNFWMMGETGPCGPCSELHVDLTPLGDTRGALVNKDDPRSIEIWNLVFIEFNANGDGTFSKLPQRHVDTGMGFERVTAIIQGTKNLTDFSGIISNYETDVFRPIFDELEKLSGKEYASTLPGRQASSLSGQTSVSLVGSDDRQDVCRPGQTGRLSSEQEKIDISFRVIADHIRALSFAIADGIIPSNEGRGYVLRRILRRAVRYGRTLGFHEPFFYKLVGVIAHTVGDIFPEVRAKQQIITDTIRREEEAFNRTLDRGIELFDREVARLLGSARFQRAASGILPDVKGPGARYSKRRLPHYERPQGIYHVTFSTRNRRVLSPAARTIVLNAFRHFDQKRYELFAVCVMPDHVHALIQPAVKLGASETEPVFWSMSELLHSIKSFSGNEINKLEQREGEAVWEKESFDRLMRSDNDIEEKFLYICGNAWKDYVAEENKNYEWLWTWEDRERQDAARGPLEAGAPLFTEPATPNVISGDFAFKLYDTYGFPVDLTELMARERGFSVDVAEFNRLMEQQRDRARKSQKRDKITVLQLDPSLATEFVGYERLETPATITHLKQTLPNIVVSTDRSPFYAAMGGQVADTGLLRFRGRDYSVSDVQKQNEMQLLRLTKALEIAEIDAAINQPVRLQVDVPRRRAIERHHTVTHLLHWALHQVVSPDAAQKGSYVGPDKLTFDFSSAALTKEQLGAVEKLVNERIAENAPVLWTEIPYAEAKKRSDIQQFFGEKYGDLVRVVQIGGEPKALNGYSMELCGGTHVRATGDIGSFKIVSESAIAAGIRRIEAVAGDEVIKWAEHEAGRQQEKFEMLARKKAGIGALPTFAKNENAAVVLESVDARAARLNTLEAEVHEWEKQHARAAEAEMRSRAAAIANELAASHSGKTACIAQVPAADGAVLQAVADALKTKFNGPILLAGVTNGRVDLVATVPKEMTPRVRANEVIQQIAPIIGGKGGGRPENARGAGKDASKLPDALAKAHELIAGR